MQNRKNDTKKISFKKGSYTELVRIRLDRRKAKIVLLVDVTLRSKDNRKAIEELENNNIAVCLPLGVALDYMNTNYPMVSNQRLEKYRSQNDRLKCLVDCTSFQIKKNK